MDIEMEDETSSKTSQSIVSPMFNRPPPQIFGQSTGLPSAEEFNQNEEQPDNGSTSHDRERDFRGRGRERERDNRNRGPNRDNRRNDFSSERSGDRNARWSDRARSRDNADRPDSRERNERRSRDRNDKSLQDRLRDLAADGNNRSGDWNSMQWREGPLNFGNGSRRPISMSGAPPALEDIRIPMPLESLRGPPIGAIANKGHHGRAFGEFPLC